MVYHVLTRMKGVGRESNNGMYFEKYETKEVMTDKTWSAWGEIM